MKTLQQKSNKTVYTPADCELLAPAGDVCSLKVAIDCGADAVYLGLEDFNARKKAENFTAENLASSVRLAHFYGVKVYVTLNTLVKDGEFGRLLALVRTAIEAKVDAFIVQDMGVALALRRAFPDIVLHASTQLGVHNAYGAVQAEKFGFKRVVLSRETKLCDIREIREKTNLEIEYFVQGALCVAFSGNCYLSAKECGASGNRGECKQLCRLPYVAELDGKKFEGYLLSAKDLCLANSLFDLISAGVTSIKIEGRLRRSEYVGTAVRAYREILTGIKRGEAGVLSQTDGRDLRVAFARGEEYLERAYLDEGTPFVIEKRYNNHTGVRVGTVKKAKPFKSDLYEVTVRSDCELASGDGLKFYSGDGGAREIASAGLGDVKKTGRDEYTFVTKAKVCAGAQVNLISSRKLAERIAGESRRAEVDIRVTAVAGERLKIVASSGGISVEVEGKICERAINAPTDGDTLIAQAGKTGDSGFVARHITATAKDAFVAKSEINALRRRALELLKDKIIKSRENDVTVLEDEIKILCEGAEDKRKQNCTHLKFIAQSDIDNGGICITDTRTLAVLRPSEYTAKNVKAMIDALGAREDRVALQLPVIANGKDLAKLDRLLSECGAIKTLVSENIYGLEYANRGYRVIAGAGHNAMNRYAVEAYGALGASEVLPSCESREGGNKNEIPLMTFAHCPYKTLYGCDCAQCAYKEGLILSREKRRYRVARTKLHNCYFSLFEE